MLNSENLLCAKSIPFPTKQVTTQNNINNNMDKGILHFPLHNLFFNCSYNFFINMVFIYIASTLYLKYKIHNWFSSLIQTLLSVLEFSYMSHQISHLSLSSLFVQLRMGRGLYRRLGIHTYRIVLSDKVTLPRTTFLYLILYHNNVLLFICQ